MMFANNQHFMLHILSFRGNFHHQWNKFKWLLISFLALEKILIMLID